MPNYAYLEMILAAYLTIMPQNTDSVKAHIPPHLHATQVSENGGSLLKPGIAATVDIQCL